MPETLLPLPVPVTVQRYGCPFCGRRRSARKAVSEHIERCWLNPAVRACKTCANFTSEPDGEPCVPGQPCDCNRGYQQCEAGVADVGQGRIVSGCPRWKLREGDGD
jgi:hypothetical protein